MMADFPQPWHGLVEVNYDSGRPRETYKSLLVYHHGPNAGHMPQFPTAEGLVNGALIGLLAMQYVFRAERHFSNAEHWHGKAYSETFVPGAFERLKEELELSVYCMRKAIDHLIQGACLKFEFTTIISSGNLPIDSLGKLIWCKDNAPERHPQVIEAFFGVLKTPTDPTNFLPTLNIISNSYKHGFFLPEAQAYGSPNAPNIVLFDKEKNDLRRPPIVHNHDACHLVMGFQDTINRLLGEFGSRPMVTN